MDMSPSPPADTLEKRRKQIEKAKAAHLSRQLQTRLQYARLKVDHGWQRQTLNEVENLYFHHYRARLALESVLNPENKRANSGDAGPAPQGEPSSSAAPQPSPAAGEAAGETDRRSDETFAPIPKVPSLDERVEVAEDGMSVDRPPESLPSSTEPGSGSSAGGSSQQAISQPSLPPPSPPLVSQRQANQPSHPSDSQTTPRPPAAPLPQRRPARSPSGLLSPTPSSSFSSTATTSTAGRSHSMIGVLQHTEAVQAPATAAAAPSVAMTYDGFWSSHTSASSSYRTALMVKNMEGVGTMGDTFQTMSSLARRPATTAATAVIGRKRTLPAASQGVGGG